MLKSMLWLGGAVIVGTVKVAYKTTVFVADLGVDTAKGVWNSVTDTNGSNESGSDGGGDSSGSD